MSAADEWAEVPTASRLGRIAAATFTITSSIIGLAYVVQMLAVR